MSKKTRFPEGFGLNPDMSAYARHKGILNPQDQFNSFRDYHLAKGSLFLDWHAAWRVWCNNFERFTSRRAGLAILDNPQPKQPKLKPDAYEISRRKAAERPTERHETKSVPQNRPRYNPVGPVRTLEEQKELLKKKGLL